MTDDQLSIRAKPRPVRRFNRNALIGIVAATSVIVLAAAAFALRAPDRSGAVKPQELYNTTTKNLCPMALPICPRPMRM